jgi:hypothetical protein
MRNLLLACAGIIAFGALAHAGPLAPKDIQATFFTGQPFTASTPKGIKYKIGVHRRGQDHSRAGGQGGYQGRGYVDIVQGRFLHHLER